MEGKEMEKMEKTKEPQSRGQEERKEEGKEAQVRNASPGTTETRHVGSLHRGSNAQQR
jgi:hypothetical protein